MRLSAIRFGVVLVFVSALMPGAAAAQGAPNTQSLPPNVVGAERLDKASQLRTQIVIMEDVLERAVGEGIRGTMARFPEVLSGPWMFGDGSRARGFAVDGYGLFFDVEVPRLPVSIAWSMQVITRQNDAQLKKDLDELRAMTTKIADEATRRQMEKRIDSVANLTGATPSVPAAPSGMAPQNASQRVVPDTPAPETRPAEEIYTDLVKASLVKAILEQATMFRLGPNDRLTVAARGSQASSPMGAMTADDRTIYLTISGSDLEAFRTGKITAEEASKRVKEIEI